MRVDDLFSAEQPVLPVRGVHLDLKGVPPTPERLTGLLDVFAAARFNAVLVEWEDIFPWTVDERFRCETAYSPEEVRAFAAGARERGIEIIPLVQCIGHMETFLSVPGYEPLREVPESPGVLNVLADGTGALVQSLVDDVLALLPDVKRFHLGGDEAWTFGSHPDTKAYIDAQGKGALYMQHVGPILDRLAERGIRPILWHDMMIEWDSGALKDLAARADLCVWGYRGHPDQTTHHFATRHIQRFAEHGVTMWGGTAYKGADGPNIDLPDLDQREANALAWAEVAARFRMQGVLATAWSRYQTHEVQCEPIDGALDALILVGAILHDGAPPAGGREACVAALDAIGQREHFEACHAALAELADARRWAWSNVQHLREVLVTAEDDPRRRGDPQRKRLQELERTIARAVEAGDTVHKALAGLVPDVWIDRYVSERVTGLDQELAALRPRVERVLESA